MFRQKMKSVFEVMIETVTKLVNQAKPHITNLNKQLQIVGVTGVKWLRKESNEVKDCMVCFMNHLHHSLEGHRLRQKTISIMAPFLAVMLFMCYIFVTAPYGLTADGQKVDEPYVVSAGNIELAVVENKEAAEQVLQQFKASLVPDNAEIEAFESQPFLSITKKDMERVGGPVTVLSQQEAMSALNAASEGQTPLFTTKISAKLTLTKVIAHKTKVKKSDKHLVGYKKVKTKGEDGKKTVVYGLTVVNGDTVDKDVLKQTTVTKPVTKVVIKGTKEKVAIASTPYSYSYAACISTSGKAVSGTTGSDVVQYAMQFLGNPYVYGGTSLTNGTDCSGFTMSVYAHFGVYLPHASSAQRSYGKAISYSDARPGDLLFYPGHVAMYIGNGKIIHASTPSTGIVIGSATYRQISCVKRIL